jgi:hypothetical protein
MKRKGLAGLTPKTFAPLILGSSGALGVRIYRSVAGSFTSFGE